MDNALSAANDSADPLIGSVDRAATTWVVRLTSGDITPEELVEFRRWRDSDHAHSVALAQARSLWLAFGPQLEALETKATGMRRSQIRIAAIAASFIVAIFGGGIATERYNHDYTTGAGERRMFALADGTQVTLAGSSAIDVRLDKTARRVSLVRGEAYFDVVHNASHPFTVDAGANRITDIGTAFSVRRKGTSNTVEVARGSVVVASSNHAHGPIVLTADQAVDVSPTYTTDVRTIDAAKDLSWIIGRLVIENRSLADTVAKINRYYGGHIILLRDASRGRHINAVIDLSNIDDWLTALDRTGTASVSRIGNLVVLH